MLIERPRPAGELTLLPTLGGWAMPSTHAAITAALAGTVYLVTDWRSARLPRLAGAGLAAAVIVVAACTTSACTTSAQLAEYHGCGPVMALHPSRAAVRTWRSG
ncbi:acid phosphatase family membrane protein YuiD [Nocardia sp. GAS34]|uniref:hypothetical protein n=1 Tax=unclassified Nocardia TaxID=2637762 RepID=UPI003D206A16